MKNTIFKVKKETIKPKFEMLEVDKEFDLRSIDTDVNVKYLESRLKFMKQ